MSGAADEYLVKDLRKKVLRGIQGRVRQGSLVGGRCFGYRRVPIIDAENLTHGKGHRILGYKLQPVESEATTVMHIFNLFAEGLNISQITTKLNDEPSPGNCGSRIGTSQIHWNSPKVRRILQNPIYVGKLVWNKTFQIVNPSTGKKVRRTNPPESWIHNDVPELRIVSDELLEARTVPHGRCQPRTC